MKLGWHKGNIGTTKRFENKSIFDSKRWPRQTRNSNLIGHSPTPCLPIDYSNYYSEFHHRTATIYWNKTTYKLMKLNTVTLDSSFLIWYHGEAFCNAWLSGLLKNISPAHRFGFRFKYILNCLDDTVAGRFNIGNR